MDLIRINDKVISLDKVISQLKKILYYRAEGFSQQEVANRLGVDRSFISRLEAMGEIRKGNRIAVIGFPVSNKEELKEMLKREGIEFVILMSEKERWRFVKEKEGLELFNEIMYLMAQIRTFDLTIVIGSDKRIQLMEKLMDREVIGIEIGKSPIVEDKYVNPQKVIDVLSKVRRKKEVAYEASCKC